MVSLRKSSSDQHWHTHGLGQGPGMDEPAPLGDRLMGAGWAAPAGLEPCQLAPQAADRPPVTQGHRKNLPPPTKYPSGPNVSGLKLGQFSYTHGSGQGPQPPTPAPDL